MNLHPVIIVSFLVVLPLFLLLVSYQAVLAFYPLTITQEKVFQFLEGAGESAEGYTNDEISHLQDVAVVMKMVDITFYVLGILVVGLLAYSLKKKDQLQNMLRYGGIATVSMVSVMLLFLVISFNGIFTLFHQIFFPQGNWQFAVDSLLIQLFPQEFFVNFSLLMFGLTFILGISMLIVSMCLKSKLLRS